MVLGCRDKQSTILCIPDALLKEKLKCFNVSIDEDGNVKHYHIVVFKNPDGTWSMILSSPKLVEIDITEFVVK